MVTLKLIATLKDIDNNPLAGKTINFYRSSDGVNYTLLGSSTTDSSGTASITDTVGTGTYYYRVEFPGDDEYDGSSDVKQYTVSANPLFIIVSYPSSVNVNVSQSFTINVAVSNVGGADGSVEVRLKDHNGNIVSKTQVAISAGSITTVSLSATAPSTADKYTWTIEAFNINTSTVDDTKTFTLNVSAIPSRLYDWRIWLAIFLIILALLMISKRRRT